MTASVQWHTLLLDKTEDGEKSVTGEPLLSKLKHTETESSMSRRLNIAWLMWRMIQSNRAEYNDLAMESRILVACVQRTRGKKFKKVI